MKKLILTRGLPASGKSTWAKAWVAKSPLDRRRINNDDMVIELGLVGDFRDRSYNILKEAREFRLKAFMSKGYDIVLDNMNLSKTSNEEAKKFAEEYGYEIEYKDFLNISLEELLDRNSKRKTDVTEEILRKLYKKFKPTICKILAEQEVSRWVKYDKTLPECIIVDLDGTVAFNVSGRPFYGEGCKENIYKDVSCDSMIDLINAMFARESYPCDVFIITGRDESVRLETEDWLKHNYVDYTKLFMRQPKDFRSSDIVKNEIYEQNIKGKYNVVFVLEDSKKCVDMWRNNGLICLQPNEGKL